MREPFARRPRRRLVTRAVGDGLEERVYFSWLHTRDEGDAPDMPLVLAEREEAPVEKALPGKDSIVGDEHVADKAVHEPSVRAQVGGQCFVQGLLGFDRLAMPRWIERGCPDHAVQAPEDVRSLLCGTTGHSRPPGRQVLSASGLSSIWAARRRRRLSRSEERRVGKECRSRWAAYTLKNKGERSI